MITPFIYAALAIERFIIALAFKIRDIIKGVGAPPLIREKREKPEKPPIPPGYVGFVKVVDESAAGLHYVWHGRAVKMDVKIPVTSIDPRVAAITTKARPTRVYFTWQEAASKGWFGELEALMKLVKGARR